MSDAILRLVVADVVYRGKGLARSAGRVVFVPGVLPGETVSAELVRTHRNFAEARLKEVLQPSPQRVAPACPLADVCPGCRYQHAQYAEEVRLKQSQFTNLLQRLGGADPGVCRAPVPSPLALHYRNKIVLHAAAEGHTVRLGYFSEDNTTVIDVAACPLAVPPLNALLGELRADRAFMASLHTHLSVTLRWTRKDGALHWKRRNPAAGDWLTESTGLGDLRVPRGSFFQVNPAAADLLVARVAALLAEIQPAAVVDLYCGVGVFALAAGRAGVPAVMGIDSDVQAIRAAQENARDHGRPDMRFFADQAEKGFRRLPRGQANRTTLILDPPRTGLTRRLIEAIGPAGFADVLYVSCAADTLARDLKLLAAAGYAVKSAQLVDLFPRTPYFESVTHLRRGRQ